MKVEFIQNCTIYPDGEHPVEAFAGHSMDVPDDYAKILVEKGHVKADGAWQAPQPLMLPMPQPTPSPVNGAPEMPVMPLMPHDGDAK
jgi:hypothetical protein